MVSSTLEMHVMVVGQESSPFRKTRYHLNEFSSRNRPQNSVELFNLRHSSLRVTIDRAFVTLKNRFKILD
jgi:hypothetical protein